MAKAIRDAYGESLLRYGADNPRVVVLDADVSSSTKSGLFGAAFPDRFFNMGIAEANMVGVAAGIASEGLIPFVNTFAVFLTSIGLLGARAFASYSRLNMKFMGAYSGLSDAFDGPSHHSLEDIAIMRTLPGFQVFVAADEAQTDWLVQNAIETEGPMYIRLSRDTTPAVYPFGERFEAGRGKVLRDGQDAAILACGVMVGHALRAAEVLAKEGVQVRVVDMFCIKPMDKALVVESARKTGLVVTAEEHSVIGGLGGAVAEVLSTERTGAVQRFIGVNDCHAECGPYSALMKKYGLDAERIAACVREALAGRRE